MLRLKGRRVEAAVAVNSFPRKMNLATVEGNSWL
jgi:hypothetical protein